MKLCPLFPFFFVLCFVFVVVVVLRIGASKICFACSFELELFIEFVFANVAKLLLFFVVRVFEKKGFDGKLFLN